MNINGVKFEAECKTLCLVEGSFLAMQFSEMWEDKVTKDAEGRIMFTGDAWDVENFEILLHALQLWELEHPGEDGNTFRLQMFNRNRSMEALLDFLGMPPPMPLMFEDSEILLDDDHREWLRERWLREEKGEEENVMGQNCCIHVLMKRRMA